MEATGVLIVLGILLGGILLAIRNREKVAHWLKMPYRDVYCDYTWRKIQLRRKIEDAQREIDLIEKEEGIEQSQTSSQNKE